LPNPAARVPPRNRRKDKQKGVAKRSGNYTGAEDELLCSAYLNVSKDAIVGINQPLMCYWQRVLQYFNENKKTPIQRTSSSLQHRWGEIQKDTAQFCSYYGEIERKNQSGKCEDDKVCNNMHVPSVVVFVSFYKKACSTTSCVLTNKLCSCPV
jgi:hypothetical protein